MEAFTKREFTITAGTLPSGSIRNYDMPLKRVKNSFMPRVLCIILRSAYYKFLDKFQFH